MIETLQAALQGGGPAESEEELREQLRIAHEEVHSAAETANELLEEYPSLASQLHAVLLPAAVGSSLTTAGITEA